MIIVEIELDSPDYIHEIVNEIEDVLGFDILDSEMYYVRAELCEAESYDHTVESLRESLRKYAQYINTGKVYLIEHITKLF